MSEQNFNKLTPAETERLAILAEELSEAIQIVGKILRHGFDSYNPFDKSKTENHILLSKELGHVQFAISQLTAAGDLSPHSIDHYRDCKREDIKAFLHHQDP